MVDIVIKNGLIVTMDGRRRVLNNTSLAIENGRIIALGRNEKIAAGRAKKVIDAKGQIVLPGLINAHGHNTETLQKSLGDDLSLLSWLTPIVFSTLDKFSDEDCYYSAQLSSLELMRSGCTTTVDNHHSNNIAQAKWSVEGLIDIGMRAVFCTMPNDYFFFKGEVGADAVVDTQAALGENERLIKDWHGKAGGRMSIWMGIAEPANASTEYLKGAKEIADRHRVGCSIHLHEARRQVEMWKEKFGVSPIEYCHELGIMGPKMLAAHCVWLSGKDFDILKKTDTKVVHNPLSNMYIASGVAPIPELLNAGITVGLGTDGAASNNNQDMFEVMKTAAILHKVNKLDPMAMTGEKVLEMATIDGARAIGQERDIGSIEIGKKADLVIFDPRRPNMVPINRLVSQLVYCGKAYNVRTVVIDGRVVMEDGRIKTVDEDAVLKKAQELSDRLVERAGIADKRRTPWRPFAWKERRTALGRKR